MKHLQLSTLSWPTTLLHRSIPASCLLFSPLSGAHYVRHGTELTFHKHFTSTSKLTRGHRLDWEGPYGIRESYESNKHWLSYEDSGTAAETEKPLWQLRRAIHQAIRQFSSESQGARTLTIIKHVLDLCTSLVGQGQLEPLDIAGVSRLLLASSRRQPKSMKEEIMRYVDLFVDHYVRKRLPPHPSASLYLLGYYCEVTQYSSAMDFWTWLIRQEDSCVNTQVYAAGIRLLVETGQPLQMCESLYEEALKRCSYREVRDIMRPNTVLPKALHRLYDLSIDQHLCMSVFEARIRRSDWQGGYLTVDTAFRLWPSTVSFRIFHIVLKTRHVHEAYQVYILLC